MKSIRSSIFGSPIQILACYFVGTCLSVQSAVAQVTVMEIRVIDGNGKGVKSHIIERARDKRDLTVDDTDSHGLFEKPIKCPEWHRLFARPVAGPYTQSDYTACETKMVLRVWNVNAFAERPVRVIVPFALGGASDLLARVIGQELSRTWGQQVVVENRPGAGGSIGAALAAEAAPNGYTLLWVTSQIFTAYPSLHAKLPYNPERDFVPVTMVATVPELLVANPSFPVRSVGDLVRTAKAKLGEINFASAGYGTTSHLAGELFNVTAGVRIRHVEFGGSAPAVSALMGGQVQIAFSSAPSVASDIKAGKLRVLGVNGSKRSSLFPDVPTIAESGIRGYEVNSWYGVFSPALS